jgi:hypothetical protein
MQQTLAAADGEVFEAPENADAAADILKANKIILQKTTANECDDCSSDDSDSSSSSSSSCDDDDEEQEDEGHSKTTTSGKESSRKQME